MTLKPDLLSVVSVHMVYFCAYAYAKQLFMEKEFHGFLFFCMHVVLFLKFGVSLGGPELCFKVELK